MVPGRSVAATAPCRSRTIVPEPRRRDVLVITACVFLACCAMTTFVAPHFFEFSMEPDFQYAQIEQFRRFFHSPHMSYLTKPFPYSYFDGFAIPAALVANLLEALSSVSSTLRTYLPTDQSCTIAAVVLVSIVSYAGATTLFFATVFEMTHDIVIAVPLTIAFYLAPQMLAINIVRVDYAMMFFVVLSLYVGVRLALDRVGIRSGVALGAGLAVAAAIKNNGPMFGLFPLLAILLRSPFQPLATLRRHRRFIASSLAAFVVVFALFMFRYWHYLRFQELLQLYPESLKVFLAWKDIYVADPIDADGRWGYYNLFLLRPHGLEFVALEVISVLALTVVAVIKPSRLVWLFVVSLALFYLAGVASLKYQRGGYHMLPIIYGAIGLLLFEIMQSRLRGGFRIALVAAVMVALTSSIVRSARFFGDVAAREAAVEQTIEDLWIAPRKWIAANYPAGGIACVEKSSQWALPPRRDLKVTLSEAVLDVPYTVQSRADVFMPPTFDAVEKACEFMMLDNLHLNASITYSHVARTQQAWRRFYSELAKRYPPVQFTTTRPQSGGLSTISIYRIRQHPQRCLSHNPADIMLSKPFDKAGGAAYYAPVPSLEKSADSMTGTRSNVILCEGDKELGPAHALHDEIRAVGHGAFSHWIGGLVFSSSDNSDPNANGRQFRVVVPIN